MTTSPAQVLPVQKKPFQIDPAFLDAVYQALLKTDLTAEDTELKAALEEAKKYRSEVCTSLWYYQHYVKECVTKKYTTEDQKIAGCLGTDTLNQCSNKLFNKCFSTHKNSSFLNYQKKMLEAADRLDKAQKVYTGKLKVIPQPK